MSDKNSEKKKEEEQSLKSAEKTRVIPVVPSKETEKLNEGVDKKRR